MDSNRPRIEFLKTMRVVLAGSDDTVLYCWIMLVAVIASIIVKVMRGGPCCRHFVQE